MKPSTISRILGGLAIIGVAALFILHQIGAFGFYPLEIGEFISRYWPLAPLLMGLATLFSGGSIWAGAAMFIFGLAMLSRNMGYSYFSFGDAFRYLLPIAAILFGLRMIFSRDRRKRDDDDKWGDKEWTSYTSYQGSVPPAPPLHPDPLRPADESGRRAGDDGGYGSAGERGDAGRYGGAAGGAGGGVHAGADGERGSARAGGSQGEAGYGSRPRREEYESGSGGSNPWKQAKREWKQAGREWKQAGREYRHAHKRHQGDRRERHHGRTEWWNTDSNVQTRSNFIGDIHLGHDYWDLVPLNISHFIGDTVLDLTRANIPAGETKITISSFIGDVKVFLPSDFDVGIQVVSSAFIGDSKVLGRKEGGVFQHSDTQSPSFRDSERRIKLVCSTFIGDVRVTKVG